MEKFLSSVDLAKRWGVTGQAVTNRKTRHEDFPRPVGKVGNVPLFKEKDIKEYEKRHMGEKRGRGKKK